MRVASLYSGCGGLDLGFVDAGFEVVWANELDPVAASTYTEAIGRHIVVGDIDDAVRTLPEPGSIDVVIGGPPCQGFSVVGKMNPDDPRSHHVWRFLEIVEYLRPRAFVMENVKALGTNSRWSLVRSSLRAEARRLEYNADIEVLNAAHFGVPQRRERMFFVGVKYGEPPELDRERVDQRTTVRAALAALPRYGRTGNRTGGTALVTPAKQPIMRRSPYQGCLLFNGNGRVLDLDAPAPTLPASMGGNATPIIDQEELEYGTSPWVKEYHQHLLRGGKPWSRVPRRMRRITVEEAAALQTFPVGMAWHGTVSAKYRQIGNAVPPRLAKHVALQVAEALGVSSEGRPDASPLALRA